jgi:hypothetical protein
MLRYAIAPPGHRRGGCGMNKKDSHLIAADGVVDITLIAF